MSTLRLVDGADFDRAARKLVADLIEIHPDRDRIRALSAGIRLTYAPPSSLVLTYAGETGSIALVGVDTSGDPASEWIATPVERLPGIEPVH